MLLLIHCRLHVFFSLTLHLHSTMLLLILYGRSICCGVCSSFTFHYASTYTGFRNVVHWPDGTIYIPLCFYLYTDQHWRPSAEPDLHSTMLLLIRVINAGVGVDGLQFTFHYASTYTRISLAVSSFTLYLHSTMLLLILIFTSAFLPVLPIFTFHYASTYTLRNVALPVPGLHLHSTMLLLILNCFHSHTLHINIYIPLCFYLYFQSCQQSRLNYNIYIPLCFYLYEYANSCIASFYTFTFHYASTYTTAARTAPCASCIIYIPLCFYLYAVFYDALKLSDNIYIPLCFYLYAVPGITEGNYY